MPLWRERDQSLEVANAYIRANDADRTGLRDFDRAFIKG